MICMIFMTLSIHQNIINKKIMKQLRKGLKTWFIKSINIAGALVRLKTLTKIQNGHNKYENLSLVYLVLLSPVGDTLSSGQFLKIT